MKNLSLRNLIFILALFVAGTACNNSSGSDDDGNPATVEGRVENTSSSADTSEIASKLKPVEGAAVTAARIQSDGSLETITDSSAQTDAEGEFTLQISEQAVADANEVIIRAENEGETAKAFVSSEIESGATALIQPITYESAAEATVLQQLIASGSNENGETVEKADIEAIVSAEVATDIESDSSLAAEVAAALRARAAAHAEFYNTLGIEVNEDQRSEINQIKRDAQSELENRLYASAESEGSAAAFDDFIETIAQAEMEAGINPTAAAKASEGSSHVLVDQSSGLSDEAQAEIRQQAAYMNTFSIDAGVQAQLENAGAPDGAVSSAGDAAVTLRTEIRALENPSEEELSALFESYNSVIVDIVESEFNQNGSLFAAANVAVNQAGGPKATLESTLAGTAGVNSVVSAYSDFYAEIDSITESTFSSATDEEIATYFRHLLILINMS